MEESKQKSDSFWGDDIEILWNVSRLNEFFPLAEQSLSERVNAFSRLIIYISIAVAMYQNKSLPVQFGLFLLVLIYIMWKNKDNKVSDDVATRIEKSLEKFSSGTEQEYTGSGKGSDECTRPTKENPFMNVLYGDSVHKPPACQDPGSQEMASNLLKQQLFMDVDDLFDRRSNERLFTTVPSKVPDKEKYTNWLIGGISDCKTDGICPPYDDVRYDQKTPVELIPGFNF